MSPTRLIRPATVACLLALAACQDTRGPVAPSEGALQAPEPSRPLYSVVDPGAEVNSAISVTPILCTETGTVTVTLSGVRPPPQDVPLDLMLVLDESGSISSAQWNQIRAASLDLLDRLDAADGAADQSLSSIRVGIIEFASSAVLNVPLSGNYGAIRSYLLGMPQSGGQTNITGALDLARNTLAATAAANAAKAVVFMTDGQATAGGTSASAQIASAEAVKALPARLFIVGAGSAVNTGLLQTMASASSYVPISDFAALGTAFDEVATQALTFPAAKNLTFTADVPAGFSLVAGSASASKGTATEGAASVSWSVAELVDETITLTYHIQHDAAAEPAGGTLTAVSNAQLQLTTPVSGNPYSESLADVTAEVQGCDVTPPAITPQVAGTLGDNDWYVSDIAVSWLVVDGESPITAQSGCDPSTVSADTPNASFTCSATSTGGTASATVNVKRDATLPTVSYAGAQPSYDVAETVGITCSAADNLSGVASTTCSDVSGPAWSFPLGANTFTAQAVDNAGNVGSGSVSFSVSVSYAGLCTLVRSFVSQQGVANSLCVKLDAAAASAARGNDAAKRNQLNAFIAEVNAQAGTHVPADKEPVLVALANALM